MTKLKCILLIDDNPADNRYHQIILESMDIAEHIEFAMNGLDALDFLNNKNNMLPDLIFLDINMPKMNGWEFLAEYKSLDANKKAKVIIVILSTSANPADIKRSQEISEVADFETKPLSEEAIANILEHYF